MGHLPYQSYQRSTGIAHAADALVQIGQIDHGLTSFLDGRQPREINFNIAGKGCTVLFAVLTPGGGGYKTRPPSTVICSLLCNDDEYPFDILSDVDQAMKMVATVAVVGQGMSRYSFSR